jgi:predicted nuclease with RNAse H fold
MRQRTAPKRDKILPYTLGPMRSIEHKHFTVIEVYPGGAQDVLGIPRKQQGLDKLRSGLEKLGITGLNEGMSDHEPDAVTCAFVGKLLLEGKTVTLRDSGTGNSDAKRSDRQIIRKGIIPFYTMQT